MLFFTLESHFLFWVQRLKQSLNYDRSIWTLVYSRGIISLRLTRFLPIFNKSFNRWDVLAGQFIISLAQLFVRRIYLILHGLYLLQKFIYTFWCFASVPSLNSWWFTLGCTLLLINLLLETMILGLKLLDLQLGGSKFLRHHSEHNFISLDKSLLSAQFILDFLSNALIKSKLCRLLKRRT